MDKAAHVTLHCKVFIPQEHIEDLMDTDESLSEEAAFEQLIREEIADEFNTDEPFKLNEIIINPS